MCVQVPINCLYSHSLDKFIKQCNKYDKIDKNNNYNRGNNLDIAQVKLCSKLNEWLSNYNGIHDKDINNLPIHPLCNQYSDSSWNINYDILERTNNECLLLTPNVSKDSLYIVLKGTSNITDIITDLNATPIPCSTDPYHYSSNVYIHSGIYSSCQLYLQDIVKVVHHHLLLCMIY